MHCISKYTTNGIFSMILNFNQPTILMKPKNLQLLYISILKNKKASGHSHILLTSVRACSSWLNSSWPGTHMLIRYGSMTPRGAHMRPLPGGGGGGTQSGFIRGCAAPGSEPLPYFRENRTPKTYPILGKSHNPRHPKRSGLQKHTLF